MFDFNTPKAASKLWKTGATKVNNYADRWASEEEAKQPFFEQRTELNCEKIAIKQSTKLNEDKRTNLELLADWKESALSEQENKMYTELMAEFNK